MIKSCVICGVDFEARQNKKCCSPECCQEKDRRYRQTAEYREKEALRRATPQARERNRLQKQTPGSRAKQLQRQQTQEYRDWWKAYRSTTEFREKAKAYREKPENREKRRAYYQSLRASKQALERGKLMCQTIADNYSWLSWDQRTRAELIEAEETAYTKPRPAMAILRPLVEHLKHSCNARGLIGEARKLAGIHETTHEAVHERQRFTADRALRLVQDLRDVLIVLTCIHLKQPDFNPPAWRNARKETAA